ncbi:MULTISPECIES: VOC family protein [unclassified Aureimonas]|uniref:VOC family protein n=1 Tax=unclassified Aureimonas TaxID=2615206 RepID=UPI000700BE5D|nr:MULTISPECIES: VOC family protein [unclassified Aureimonas]KQT53848.1 glyoxalase [Aureimonas sp. Leaf427]KQT71711.1 glyoxalase [Aureimonas sp. Leaf460]
MRDARITLVTLGVSDLQRASAFYEALGWTRTQAGNESVVFLQGEGLVLSLFGLADLAKDAGLTAEPLPAFRGVTLAINLPSEAETDRLFDTALGAGATAVKRPEKVFWGGYSGYFADPDGHLWELAHNPFFAMDERGLLDLDPARPETAS